MTAAPGPAVLPGMGGYLLFLLAGCNPWAVAEVDGVDAALESALGAYPVHPSDAWSPRWDPEDISYLAEGVPANPKNWTDGSRDEDLDAMGGCSWCWSFCQNCPWVFDDRVRGHAQDLGLLQDAARIFPWCIVLCRQCHVLNTGELSSSSKHSCQFTWALTKNVCNNVGNYWLVWYTFLSLY